MAGQNNHFLVTILVGLSAVEDGTAELPSEMRTSWAPHDRSRSAMRSREFAIKSSLAWLVDAIDAYIRTLQQPPRIANMAALSAIADADAKDEGLAGRVRAIAGATGQADSSEAILAEVSIIWRNRLVHRNARNQISKRLSNAARGHAAQYAESYQGLIIDDLIRHVEHKPSTSPTLKEVTAVIRAVHKLIERVDEHLLQSLDLEPYLHEILRQYLTEDKDANPPSVMVRAGNVWGKSPDRCRSTIRQIALNSGLTPRCDGALNELTATAIENLVHFSPAEAVKSLIT